MWLRRAHIWFLSLLAQDWVVRTENPWEANLFFLPTFNNHNGGNVGWQSGSAGGQAELGIGICMHA